MGALTPWLLGPCPLLAQRLLQFRLGERAGMAAVPSLWVYATHRGCLRTPLPARGETDPSQLSASWPGPLTPGVCIYISMPLPSHITCMLYSTAKV